MALRNLPAVIVVITFEPRHAAHRLARADEAETKQLDVFARKIIRQAHEAGHGNTLLTRLMDATRADTGRETTATALSWAWYLPTLHPEALACIRREVDDVAGGRPLTADDVPSLRYTRN